MTSKVTFALLLVLALVLVAVVSTTAKRDIEKQRKDTALRAEDGMKCAVCVLAVQEAIINLKTSTLPIRAVLKLACNAMPNDKAKDACKSIVENFTEDIVAMLISNETADFICSKIKLCVNCHITQGPNYYLDRDVRRNTNPMLELLQMKSRVFASALFHQWKAHPDEPAHVGSKPTIDLDKDWFSSVHFVKRGANWRGRDCSDFDKNTRPGVKEDASGKKDRDCNGIPANAEQKYCSGENAPRQVINLGDSATAGFGIPVEWIKLKNLTSVLSAFIDELDHPYQAWGSGWDTKKCSDSLYLRMRERNRCYHRQFQNVGKNGGDIFDLSPQIDTISTNAQSKPALVTIAYIGNDICQTSLDQMTTPEEYEEKLKAGLAKLDSVLVPGSKVVLFGLVDGSILFDLMGNIQHPLGSNITYAQFYDFLSCVGQNPCNTWLTSNAATRAAASARAMELNDVAELVAKNAKFKNFDLLFVDFVDLLDEAFGIVEKQGKPLHSLIDPVDGFHPNIHVGHPILSSVLWSHLQGHPDFIGEVNPHNAAIEKEFGNQGGY